MKNFSDFFYQWIYFLNSTFLSLIEWWVMSPHTNKFLQMAVISSIVIIVSQEIEKYSRCGKACAGHVPFMRLYIQNKYLNLMQWNYSATQKLDAGAVGREVFQ